jgi:hypothetical protein
LEVHPNSLSNLNPVQKGDVGRNPNGRPKGARSIKTILREITEAMGENEEGVKAPVGELIWYKAAKQALEGDKDARRDIADRLEGKPLQKTEEERKDVNQFSSEKESMEYLSELGLLPETENPEIDTVNKDFTP